MINRGQRVFQTFHVPNKMTGFTEEISKFFEATSSLIAHRSQQLVQLALTRGQLSNFDSFHKPNNYKNQTSCKSKKKKKTQSNSEVSMNTTSSNISAKSRCLYLKNKMFGVEQELIKELIRTLLLCRMFIFEIQATFNRRIGYQISRDNLVLSTWQSLLSILALFLYMMSSR